jgi:hypothetical protein
MAKDGWLVGTKYVIINQLRHNKSVVIIKSTKDL